MQTLLELVDEIKAELDDIKAELKKLKDHRLQVAIKITKARELVDKGDPAAKGMTWEEFATEHFGLSWSEVKKLVKIGSSDDPPAAMAAVREKTRKSAAKSRKPKLKTKLLRRSPCKAETNGGGDNPEPGTVEQQRDRIICAYKAASNDARKSFRQWLADKDGNDALPGDLPVAREPMRGLPAQAIPAK